MSAAGGNSAGPSPYYDHAGITIFLGDCLQILPLLEADVLSLDPPYGTDEHGGYGRRQLGLETIANDSDTGVRDAVLLQWMGRPAIVFGSPRRPEPVGPWDYRLVWDKRSPGLGAPWRWQHEMIYLRGEWDNQPGTPSVLSFAAGNAMRERWHPHEKPVPLMFALLRGTAGVIVDACMGSGSTLRAAKDLGRRAIGIEIDERYCEIAARRLSQEVLFA
jgi:site-specific DNA-methyltransferase (adenine-specific)